MMKPNVEQMVELLKGDIRCGGIGPSDLVAGYTVATDEQKKALGLTFLVRYGKELPGYRALWTSWQASFGAPALYSLGRTVHSTTGPSSARLRPRPSAGPWRLGAIRSALTRLTRHPG